MIKHLTTTATEQAFSFDDCNYFWVKNTGDGDVSVSPYSGITTDGDDVVTLAKGEAVRIPAVANRLYAKGAGTLDVHALQDAICPFDIAGKGGGSGDGVHFRGSTTTALTDGATTNPITIDGSSYTAVMGDMVIYGNKEFLFDGTSWHEMGDLSDTVGRKYYVDGNARGEIFNVYEGTYQNTAPGVYSTAEGKGTYALGETSHAAGLYTQATGNAQFVVGKYNDPFSNDLFEVGNGTGTSSRSNILEVSRTRLNVNGDIQQNGISIRATTMPTIISRMLGTVVQYIGTTDGTYVKGCIYVAVSDGATYSWQKVGVESVSLTYTAETEALTLTVS